MRKLAFVFIVAFAFSTTAMAVDIAISTEANWWGQAAADREMQEIVDNVTAVAVERFAATEQDALATWVADHTGDGISDLLIMCGAFPDTIYTPGNTQADDSLAELFLDDGNTIINTGDYMFYVVNGAGTNAAGGLQTMMDIGGITMWDDDTACVVTADGQEYTPSLTDVSSDRPFHIDELEGDWEVELILAGNDAGTRADPVIVRNSDTGGRLGIFFQTASQDDDPRGEVISEWINNWYLTTVGGGGNPYARRPDPEDGALYPQTWGTLTWRAGFYAVSHDLYMGTSFDDVNDGVAETFVGNLPQTMQIVGFAGFPVPDGLVPGTTYYWRVDEVNDANVASPWKGDVWSFWIPPRKAYDPSVPDGAKYVATDVELSWTTGFGAKLHTVYFGDDLDTVTNAAGGLAQATTTFSPGALEADKTYYWRVDEFEVPSTHTGDVWSFTTVPNVPIGDPDLIGWWTFDEGAGITAVDWSGHGNHGTLEGDPEWTGGYDGGALNFGGGGDFVSTGKSAADLGIEGANPKTVTAWVYTEAFNNGGIFDVGGRSDGQDFCLRTMTGAGNWRTQYWGGAFDHDFTYAALNKWVHFALVYSGTQSTVYANGISVSSVPRVLDTATTNPFQIGRYGWPDAYFNGTIDDVRLYNKALTPEQIAEVMLGNTKLAGSPAPDRNAIVDIRDIGSLSWSAGDAAASHDVYFGANSSAPEFQGNQAGTSLSLAGLVELGGGDYYWRVDEVEADGTVNTGTTWKFSVPDHLIVDNFESYDDVDPTVGEPGANRIFDKWIDGFGTTTNGALVGNDMPPYAEQTIVQSGTQSMIYRFDNAGKTSEATLAVARRDWTEQGVTKLSVGLRGSSANAADRVYIALNGTAVVYHDDPAATQLAGWNEWVIDLATFGVSLTNVNSITIGIGTQNSPAPGGGAGTMYFDDIGLIK